MVDLNKEKFEEMEQRIAEKRDSFQAAGEDLMNKVKDAKEGWESARAERDDKHEIAEAEETGRNH
ncbi:hypothetical protein D2E26_0168 [Bifidobacterium dolichotidis]|uniref:Uncharacterized protein n=1 Tax=Bifidobacterium dolichotidis TaxID=2306976 RepID=A0A430FRX8_9BIFI|nr:hypothetical protein [Bifidobacterium dolichotidis]RSX55605.1 hypothetical protein D2E26_0168 [Bifidobacterium dolichotidis]